MGNNNVNYNFEYVATVVDAVGLIVDVVVVVVVNAGIVVFGAPIFDITLSSHYYIYLALNHSIVRRKPRLFRKNLYRKKVKDCLNTCMCQTVFLLN